MTENFWGILGTNGVGAAAGSAIAIFLSELLKSYLRREENQESADYKNKLNIDMEKLKIELSAISGELLDRRIKLNEKEFSGLSECWDSLDAAFVLARQTSSKFYPVYDVSKMDDHELEVKLTSVGLSHNQISIIKISDNKNATLSTFLRANDVDLLKEKSDDLTNKIKRHSLFIPEPVVSKFEQLSIAIENSWYASNMLLNKNLSVTLNPTFTFKMLEINDEKYVELKKALFSEIKDQLRKS